MNVIHVQTCELVQGSFLCPKSSLGANYLQGDSPKTSLKQPPIQIPIDKCTDLMPKNPNAADHSFYIEQQSW